VFTHRYIPGALVAPIEQLEIGSVEMFGGLIEAPVKTVQIQVHETAAACAPAHCAKGILHPDIAQVARIRVDNASPETFRLSRCSFRCYCPHNAPPSHPRSRTSA